MEPKNYSTIRSLLKKERGEKIAPCVFKVENGQAVKTYLEKEGITYETYQQETSEPVKNLSEHLIAGYEISGRSKNLAREDEDREETIKALELLSLLEDGSVSLVFLDPQYEKADEMPLASQRRNHPHQKPFLLIKSIIEATTQEGDLVVDPCAGSFIVLEACQETEREFLGCDLTFEKMQEYRKTRKSVS
ncbi:6441_t:CDS:2 [Racocetra fulgida]|uniref:6441_t:CDS:1 n=1 Tax=Racocetra fulgida TaxID=60492 RepID=A0A9N9C4H9_9GLOM|nr:6441_t:CDS:2 [Racocetra fulgida]